MKARILVHSLHSRDLQYPKETPSVVNFGILQVWCHCPWSLLNPCPEDEFKCWPLFFDSTAWCSAAVSSTFLLTSEFSHSLRIILTASLQNNPQLCSPVTQEICTCALTAPGAKALQAQSTDVLMPAQSQTPEILIKDRVRGTTSPYRSQGARDIQPCLLLRGLHYIP